MDNPAASDGVELTSREPSPAMTEDTKLIENSNQNADRGGVMSYPKSIFFIILNEFCERFSYYGMRAILAIYLTKQLHFSADDSTAIFHAFVIVCYLTPLLGAVLADGYIGKYWTILGLSLVYLAGNIVMTFTAFPPPGRVGPMIGLVLIGLGTGGIKPCVSAFGGDQFTKEQETTRAQFFSFFYFAINLGSLFSMIVTPLVREYVQCFGTQCYPLAFGIPAAIMLVSIVLFVAGTPLYKRQPPTGSVIQDFFKCIGTAIKMRVRQGNQGKDHWLDYAEGIYQRQFLEDVKAVLRVFVLFLPLPIFWSLFDQQGSRWNLQGIFLNKYVTPDFYLPADIVPAINPILILGMIPMFDFLIYPLFDRLNIFTKLPHRMIAGMVVIALTFVVSAVLQIEIESQNTYKDLRQGESSLFYINAAPCSVQYESTLFTGKLDPLKQTNRQIIESGSIELGIMVGTGCGVTEPEGPLKFSLIDQADHFIVTALQDQKLVSKLFTAKAVTDELEGSLVGVIGIGYGDIQEGSSVALNRFSSTTSYSFNLSLFESVDYKELMPGRYEGVLVNGPSSSEPIFQKEVLSLGNRAVVTLIVQKSTSEAAKNSSAQMELVKFDNVPRATVSVWCQFPQYFLVSIAEVLFSISGLRFAYEEAPVELKSVVTAGWLWTTAFGSVIVAIIAEFHMQSRVAEFFLFACLMAVTTLVFGFLAYRYNKHSTQ